MNKKSIDNKIIPLVTLLNNRSLYRGDLDAYNSELIEKLRNNTNVKNQDVGSIIQVFYDVLWGSDINIFNARIMFAKNIDNPDYIIFFEYYGIIMDCVIELGKDYN